MADESGNVWDAVSDDELGKAPFAVKIYKNGKYVKTVRLEPEVTYVGRMPENHIVLDDKKVSRSHVRIARQHNKFQVEDQQSENGVYVNGKRVGKAFVLPGDKVKLGDHTLELVMAEAQDQESQRENQLDALEQEEWRMDQTLSLNTKELQEAHQERMKKTQTQPKKSPPTLMLALTVGSKTIEKTVVLDKGRARDKDANPSEQIEIKVVIGNWILEKKVTLA